MAAPSPASDPDVEFVDLSGDGETPGAPLSRVPVPLNYKRAILRDVLGNDGLAVVSKGLGLRDIVSKALKLYCVPGSLVFVLNAGDEGPLIRECLSREGWGSSVFYCAEKICLTLMLYMPWLILFAVLGVLDCSRGTSFLA